VDLCLYDQPFGVHQQLALATVYLLAAVVATVLAAHPGSLGRLGVHHTGGGVGIAPELGPQAPADHVVQLLPGAIQPPLSEVVKDGLERRKLAREHPPLAAGLQQVEDGVEDLAVGMNSWSSTLFGSRKMGFEV
jgi:hypothetical protein